MVFDVDADLTKDFKKLVIRERLDDEIRFKPVIKKGVKVFQDAQKNGRKKKLGIKSTSIKDGVRVIRKANRR